MHNSPQFKKMGRTGGDRPAQREAQLAQNINAACRRYEGYKQAILAKPCSPADYEAQTIKAARKAGL